MDTTAHKSFGTMEVLITFGFAAFFAYYFLLILGFPGFFPEHASGFMRRLCQLATLLGLTCGAFLTVRNVVYFEKHVYTVPMVVLWGVAGCLAPAVVMLESGLDVHVPLACTLLAMFIAGLAAGFFFAGWGNVSSRGRLQDALVGVGTVMVIGIALFLIVTMFMLPLAQGAMGIVFIVTCCVMFYAAGNAHEEGKGGKSKKTLAETDTALEDADSSHTFNTKLDVLLLVCDIPLGYSLPIIYELGQTWFYAAVGVALAGLVAFIVLTRFIVKDLTFVNLLRCSMGACAVMFLLSGINATVVPLCAIVLFAVWFVMRLAHASTLLRLTNIHAVIPVMLTVRGKIPGYLGFALGFLASILLTQFVGGGWDVLTAGMLVIVGFLFVAALVLFPFSESYSKQLEVLPVIVDTRASTAEEIDRAKCKELARRYGLSPREEEILYFIVKGRNARYIAEKLVISESTAKTHIHNIYKKSGIHSQQKFIDIMDELV